MLFYQLYSTSSLFRKKGEGRCIHLPEQQMKLRRWRVWWVQREADLKRLKSGRGCVFSKKNQATQKDKIQREDKTSSRFIRPNRKRTILKYAHAILQMVHRSWTKKRRGIVTKNIFFYSLCHKTNFFFRLDFHWICVCSMYLCGFFCSFFFLFLVILLFKWLKSRND